jgi:two-component sensor histidine kinase
MSDDSIIAAPPPAPVERDRLAVLASYRVLDTPPERSFDAIVKLAAELCQTPIAAISLVAGNRQWFKAEIGLGVSETSLVVAVCDDLIQAEEARSGEVMSIEDLSLDPRFSDNPLVASDPKLRFYAGAPLLTGDGLCLGMLCVLDTKPRSLTPAQRESLRALAAQTMALLELRRLLAERDDALAQKDLLVRELHHRVKNTLATVQSVMTATARASTTLPEFQDAFAGRVVALAKTHALLTDHDWQSASFEDLALAELEPFDDGSDERILLEGPPVILPSDLAIPIGMALHELTSNAAKHGALADPKGRLELRWRVERGGSGETFCWEWNEHDGPPVRLPTREGFGTRLLDRVLTRQLGAEVDIHYEPDGLRISVEVPLPGVE